MTLPPLLIAAFVCLLVAEIIGLLGLRYKLELTATLAVLLLLAVAVTFGILGGLRFLPSRI